jgi:hypothetical protein
MNTNGALQNQIWWKTLGNLFHGIQDYVVFSIDGLEDTNHLYRRGVVWHKLRQNLQAYIDTGASAHWDMLVYRHNEHQVDACEQLARELGFTWFRAKISKRPMYQDLQAPRTWAVPPSISSSIRCHVLREQSIYIDAQGRQSPCCWLGSRQKDFIVDIDQVIPTWASDNPHPVCRSACGTDHDKSNFANQWIRETRLR